MEYSKITREEKIKKKDIKVLCVHNKKQQKSK